MPNSKYDLIAFGATGFTGQQVARTLAEHASRDHFRFAIAGRSAEKLKRLVKELARDGLSVDGTIVADALDASAMDALASQTRVVLSTAGPYAKFGHELVRACVEHGTHYVDITGETPWVRDVIDRHHVQAKRDGTRIIPCCGYDSIPSDLGALYAADQLQRKTGLSCERVTAFHRGKGGINGGTVASLLNIQREGLLSRLQDPFLLNPQDMRPENESTHRDPVIPFFSSLAKTWAAPFFMGPINTRVVRRSHALLASHGLGPMASNFAYQEYWKSPGLFGLAEASTLASVQAATSLMGWLPGAGALLERMAADPGDGPSEQTMDNGFFSCDLFAEASVGEKSAENSLVQARLEGRGDPGNRITVKCLCESALMIASDTEAQPISGGVLTPASGLGLALIPRLEAVGIKFSVKPD